MAVSGHAVIPVLLLLSAGWAAGFKFTRCGGNNDINVGSVTLDPSVITLPGKMKLGFSGKIQNPFSNIDMKLEIVRKTWLVNIKIPCLFNIGSCSYPDLCNLLDRMDRENWAGISAKISAEIRKMIGGIDTAGLEACPFKPAELEIKDRWLDLPAIPSLLALVASGDYIIKVELSNSETKSLMSCFEMQLTLKKGD